MLLEDARDAAVVEDVALAPDARLAPADGLQHLAEAPVTALEAGHAIAAGVVAVLPWRGTRSLKRLKAWPKNNENESP